MYIVRSDRTPGVWMDHFRTGGRSRTAGSAAERARINVRRTIGAVVKKIAAGSPALGQHLTAAVRTGYFCAYEPDLRVRVDWRF